MTKFLLRLALVGVFFPLFALAVMVGAIGLIALAMVLAVRFVADWEIQ